MKLVLLSGGHDSANLVSHNPGCIAVFVDYGQRAVRREFIAAVEVAGRFGVDLVTLRVDPIKHIDGVWHGRNLMLVGVAMPVAVERGCDAILIGVTPEDHARYPDCRSEFIASLDAACRSAYGVGVQAPLRQRPSYIVEGTWSCDLDGAKPCGACRSCRKGVR